MADLEDKILKKNIPGKYTWWDKDSDEEDSASGSDGEGVAVGSDVMSRVQKWEEKEIPKPLQMAMLNNARTTERGAKHTGPKGVMEDYKQHKKQEELEYEISCQIKEALLQRIAEGAVMLPGESSISAATQNAIKKGIVRRDELDYGNVQEKEKDEENEDDEFIKSYRDSRLKQLKYSTTYPTYGSLREVDAIEYAEEIDNADPRVFVVVHM